MFTVGTCSSISWIIGCVCAYSKECAVVSLGVFEFPCIYSEECAMRSLELLGIQYVCSRGCVMCLTEIHAFTIAAELWFSINS